MVRDEIISRAANGSDKAVIHPARTTCSRLGDRNGNPAGAAGRQSLWRTLKDSLTREPEQEAREKVKEAS